MENIKCCECASSYLGSISFTCPECNHTSVYCSKKCKKINHRDHKKVCDELKHSQHLFKVISSWKFERDDCYDVIFKRRAGCVGYLLKIYDNNGFYTGIIKNAFTMRQVVNDEYYDTEIGSFNGQECYSIVYFKSLNVAKAKYCEMLAETGLSVPSFQDLPDDLNQYIMVKFMKTDVYILYTFPYKPYTLKDQLDQQYKFMKENQDYIDNESHQGFTVKTCNKCKIASAKMYNCGKCKFIRYCSIDCQRSDWSEHKPTCMKLRTSGKLIALINYWSKERDARYRKLFKKTANCVGHMLEIHNDSLFLTGIDGEFDITSTSNADAGYVNGIHCFDLTYYTDRSVMNKRFHEIVGYDQMKHLNNLILQDCTLITSTESDHTTLLPTL